MFSRSLKLRGDRKPRSADGSSESAMKRENGSPLHITVPVGGWTMTPLQLIGVLVEKASDTDTTQQHLSTSCSSMLLARCQTLTICPQRSFVTLSLQKASQ